MDTNHISSFFKKVTKALFKKEEIQKSVQEIIRQFTNISLNAKEFTVRDGSISLTVRPHIKNEILLKKEKILQELKKNDHTKNINRII